MRMDRRTFPVLAAVALAVTAVAAGRPQVVTKTARFHLTGLEVLGVKVNESKRMDILMLDSAATGVAHKHFSRLCARTADIVAGSAKKDGTDVVAGCDFWSLDGYDVSITGTSDVGITATADAADIPQLSKMSNSALDKKYFGAEPGPFISARVSLTGGTLSSEFPSSGVGDFSKAKFKFDPDPDPGSYESRLADSLLTQKLSGDLVVKLTAMPGKTKTPKTITLRSAGGTTPIEVRITNNTAPTACSDKKMVRELGHFRAYYKLLTPTAVKQPIPKETTSELDCPGSLNEFIRCPPPEG